jgi:hypothetical protein
MYFLISLFIDNYMNIMISNESENTPLPSFATASPCLSKKIMTKNFV